MAQGEHVLWARGHVYMQAIERLILKISYVEDRHDTIGLGRAVLHQAKGEC